MDIYSIIGGRKIKIEKKTNKPRYRYIWCGTACINDPISDYRLVNERSRWGCIRVKIPDDMILDKWSCDNYSTTYDTRLIKDLDPHAIIWDEKTGHYKIDDRYLRYQPHEWSWIDVNATYYISLRRVLLKLFYIIKRNTVSLTYLKDLLCYIYEEVKGLNYVIDFEINLDSIRNIILTYSNRFFDIDHENDIVVLKNPDDLWKSIQDNKLDSYIQSIIISYCQNSKV